MLLARSTQYADTCMRKKFAEEDERGRQLAAERVAQLVESGADPL